MTQLGEIQIKSENVPFHRAVIGFPVAMPGKQFGLRLSKCEAATVEAKGKHISGWYKDAGNPRTRYPYTITVLLEVTEERPFEQHTEEEILNRETV